MEITSHQPELPIDRPQVPSLGERLRERVAHRKETSPIPVNESEQVEAIRSNLEAMVFNRYPQPTQRPSEASQSLPASPQIPERPEPPVVKKRWYDALPWLTLGDPKRVAEKIVANPQRFWNKTRIKSGVKDELENIHLRNSQLLISRVLRRAGSIIGHQSLHLLGRIALSIPEAIPFAGSAIDASIAAFHGRINELPIHAFNFFITDTAEVAIVGGAWATTGPILGIPATLAVLGFDVWLNASMRKHAREVNNQLIPPIARTMSYERNPNPVDPRRLSIARTLYDMYSRPTLILRRRKNKKYFDDLPREEQNLDPLNGLTPRKRRWFREDYDTLNTINQLVPIYRNLSNPQRYPLPAGLETMRDQIQKSIKRNIFLWNKKAALKRDLKTLEYFQRTREAELNKDFLHPYFEARRMRDIWRIAKMELKKSDPYKYQSL